MNDPVGPAVGDGFAHLGDRRVHEGHVWTVAVGSFRSPDGTEFERDVVRSPGAVAVVPLVFDAEGNPSVVLVEQYRPARDTAVLEIPAGMRDIADEPLEETARRELIEEVGLEPGRLVHLVDVLPSPGMTDSVTTVFLATDCTPVDRDLQGPEEEHSRVVHLPLVDAVRRVTSGGPHDAKTVIGLLLAERDVR